MKLSPVYLLLGPEIGLKTDFIETIKEELSKQGTFSTVKYYAHEKDPVNIILELQSSSLFEPCTLYLYDNIETLKNKQNIEPLISYIKNPNRSSILVLLSESASVDSTLKNSIPEKDQKIFWELFENQKEEWIEQYFKKSGLHIEKDAISFLLSQIENNTQALKNECSRLSVYFVGKKNITLQSLEECISYTKEEDAFSLFDAMAINSLDTVMKLLGKILYSKNTDPIGILAGLQWSFKRLLQLHRNMKTENQDMAYLKLGIKSKKIQAIYNKALKRYTISECEQIVASGVRFDEALRSEGSAIAPLLLELFIYESFIKKGKSIEKQTDIFW